MKINKKICIFCIIDIFLIISIIFILNKKILPANNTNITSSDITFTSYNGIFEITVPNNWRLAEQRGMLNPAADIELINDENLYYLITLMENKKDLNFSYNEYKNSSLKVIEETYNIKIDKNKVKELANNENNIVSYTFNTTLNEVEICMNIYILGTKNYYGKCLVWSSKTNHNQDINLSSIIQSIKEI